MNHYTQLEDWLQWKQVCTIALCRAETRQRLAAFGAARLRNELRRAGCPALVGEYADKDSPREAAWCAIEGFLLSNKRPGEADERSSKIYKHTFVDEREESTSAFEGGMTLLIRQNVVPAIAHGEDNCPRGKSGKPRKNVVVISRDAKDTDFEWIPSEWADPATEADYQIVEQLAADQCKNLIMRLNADQKIVLLCKLLDIPLDSALKAKVVSCKKTQLAIRYKEIIDILRILDWGFRPIPQERFVLVRALIIKMHKWAEGPELAGIRTSIMDVEHQK